MAKDKTVEIPTTDNPQVVAFFKANKDAASVFVVGDQLFFAHHEGAAKDCANRNNLTVETVLNPSVIKAEAEAETEKN